MSTLHRCSFTDLDVNYLESQVCGWWFLEQVRINTLSLQGSLGFEWL